MMKRLFCVKKNGRVEHSNTTAYYDNKRAAKALRDELQEAVPKAVFTVALGPDHWRAK